MFKSITRSKRNNLVDGKNGILDKTPHAAYYKPKYDILRKEPTAAGLGTKNIESAQMDDILTLKDHNNNRE